MPGGGVGRDRRRKDPRGLPGSSKGLRSWFQPLLSSIPGHRCSSVHCILFLHDRAACNNNSQKLRNLCSLITGKKTTSYAPAFKAISCHTPPDPIKVAGKSQHVSELCRLQLLRPDTCSCLANTYFADDTLVLVFCSYREVFQRLWLVRIILF